MLRTIFIVLMLAAAAGLGLLAFQVANTNKSQPVVASAVPPPVAPPVTVPILVAARTLSSGMLGRDSDIASLAVLREKVPAGALPDDPETRARLRGALVQRFIEVGTPITAADMLNPRERGFIAAVLAPTTRAVSVAVDPVTGVGGLIWPGDRVDVILTQTIERGVAAAAQRSVISETVLSNVRVIAIDQDIAQGVAGSNGVAGRLATTVTMQATATQAERLAVARQLGQISLAIRSSADPAPAGEEEMSPSPTAISGEDVSPALMRANGPVGTRVQVIQGDQRNEVMFR